MSKTIDQRVVEMQFDNKNFETNVQQSLSTLEKLKKSLNLEGAAKGFDDIDSASKKVNLGSMGEAVENVKLKFSALEVMAITALTNITNKAVDAGLNLIKSLSVDQISAGWDKYADKVTSVQTIMSATAQTWEESAKALGFEGTQMEFVTDQLDKLNWFSDETSYSFTDMTNNIGKFTSNGMALNDSVTAMMGISSWAAKSGQNTEAASRAMYNLSQALSVGAVKLMDWKSIENANMATQEFKQTALDTAIELGTLTKAADGTIKTLDGTEVTVSNFNTTLEKGWFSADVLMATLDEYGSAAMRLAEISEEYDITASQFLAGMDAYTNGTKTIDDIASDMSMDAKDLIPLFNELSGEEYKLGLSSFRAAQEAKTFAEAIDATKDAVSTGWMTTFDTIFGNYEEAKVLWTDLANALWDVFAASGETRNQILALWKTAGGRDDLVEAFWNVWDAVSSLVAPVKEAFGEVFPSTIDGTAKKLVEFTKRLKEITANMKISDETAQKIKTTFQGLFSIFNIGKQVLTALVKPLKTLFTTLTGGYTSILDITAFIGELITKFDNLLQTSGVLENFSNALSGFAKSVGTFVADITDAFNTGLWEQTNLLSGIVGGITSVLMQLVYSFGDAFKELTGIDISGAIEKIVTGIRKFGNTITGFIDSIVELDLNTVITNIKEFFNGFGKVDLSGLNELSGNVEKHLSPLGTLFEGLKKLIGGIFLFFKGVSPLFLNLATVVGEAFGKIGESLSNAFNDGDFNSILDLVNGGVLVSIGIGIKKFIDNLVGATDQLGKGGIFDTVKDILDGVKDSLTTWQRDVKANTLLKIAGAVAILAISLAVLAGIDSAQLTVALAAITAEFYELITAMKALTTIDAKGTAKAAGTMILMSVAVLILSSACKKLAELEWDEMLRGVVGVGLLAEALTLCAKQLSKSTGDMIKGTAGLIAFAIAIRLLVKPVKELAELSVGELAKGLISVGVLMAELAAFMKVTDLDSMGLSKGVGILALAAALLVMSKAVENFGNLDTEVLLKGLGAITAILTELAIFTQLTGDAKHVISTAIGLTILGAAMLIFSKAVESFGSLSLESLLKGLGGMAASLAMVALALNAMPATTPLIAIGLVAVGAALLIIAKAMQEIGGMSVENLIKSILGMAAALAVITIACIAMTSAIPGALALLVVSAGLIALATALKIIGSMSIGDIVKSVLTLVVTIGLIAGLSALILPVIPAMLALAGAITLLGVGVLACGAGLLMFSAAMTAFAATGVAGVTAMVVAISAIIGLIPAFARSIGQGIIEILQVLADSTTTICESLTQIGIAILDSLMMLIPKLVEFVGLIIENLVTLTPLVVQGAIDVLLAVLQGIRDNIGEFALVVTEIITEMLNAIGESTLTIVQAGVDLVINLIDGLSQGLVDNAARLNEAMTNLCQSMLDAMLVFFGISDGTSSVFSENGGNLILGLIQGIWEKLGDLTSKLTELANQAKMTIANKAKEWIGTGSSLISNLISGIGQKASSLKQKVTGLINDAKTAITNKISEWKDVGKNLIQGLIDGVGSMASALNEKVKSLAKGAVDKMKEALDVHSPSRVTKKIGQFTGKGFVLGVAEYIKKAGQVATQMATSAVDAMKYTISKLSDSIMSDVDNEPTIRPVLDLTDFEEGVDGIYGAFDDAATLKLDMSYRKAKSIQNGFDERRNSNNSEDSSGNTTNSYNFTQNNYSPKALSRTEIYRQTKNQFTAYKEGLA